MRSIYFILIFGVIFSSGNLFAQDTLPHFTVKNSKGKISVSWQNKYAKKIKDITIQSSFDSLKKFSSLKTVPDPADAVYGFFDIGVPYEKMFYRLFIVFDSGAYIFTTSKRPEVDPKFDLQKSLAKTREANKKEQEKLKQDQAKLEADKARPVTQEKTEKIATPVTPPRKEEPATVKVSKPVKTETQTITQPEEVKPEIIVKKEPVSTVSKYIYTGKDNNIVVNLPDFNTNKYVVKFYDEANERLFELNKITESFLIIEKVNFLHAGWFFFEIYKNESLLEKNKFYIPKD